MLRDSSIECRDENQGRKRTLAESATKPQCDSDALSVLAYANGFTLWHYATADLAADVTAAGYFNGASDLLRVGDMMLVNCTIVSAPAGGMLMVDSNKEGVVAVANLTPLGRPAGG